MFIHLIEKNVNGAIIANYFLGVKDEAEANEWLLTNRFTVNLRTIGKTWFRLGPTLITLKGGHDSKSRDLRVTTRGEIVAIIISPLDPMNVTCEIPI